MGDGTKAQEARWRPDPAEAWTVDAFVNELAVGATFRRCSFDSDRANQAIEAAGGAFGDGETSGWEMLSPEEARDPRSPTSGVASGYSPFAPSRLGFEGDDPECAGMPVLVQPVDSDDDDDEGPEAEGLEDVRRDLDALHLAQHEGKTGPEGKAVAREFKTRGGAREGVVGGAVQPCPYRGIVCGGCDAPFAVGEPMCSLGSRVCHDHRACRSSLQAKEAAKAAADYADAVVDSMVFYGVYSDFVGDSGVYTEWPLVERLMGDEHAERDGVSYRACSSVEEARAYVRERTLTRVSEIAPEPKLKGSLTLRAHLAEKLSDERREMIDRCVRGECGEAHGPSSTACRGGCGRHLHVATCAQMGKGFAALGNFTCADCRLKSLVKEGTQVHPDFRVTVEKTMILELGQGAEASAAGFANYVRLEDEYVRGSGKVLDGGGGGLILPRSNPEAFKNFMTWMALDTERVRSLESTVRTAGAFFCKVDLPDVTKDKGVKKHLKELVSKVGIEHEPATTATPRMLKYAIEHGIDQRFSDPFISSREKVQFLAEGVGGCRIGEVCGGGDGHGVLANNTAILEDLNMPQGEMGRLVVEFHLEHSKTGFARPLTLAGKTETSGIECAEILREYWRLAGMRVTTEVIAGVRVTRPDFWATRVSLLGLDPKGAQVERLKKLVSECELPTVKATAKAVVASITERAKITGTASQPKKYVNVAVGEKANRDMQEFGELLSAAGFRVSLTPGPLLLATTGGLRPSLKTMPLSTSSVSEVTKEILDAAWRHATKDDMDPDPDLELGAGDLPRWSSHSLRRLADTVARKYMEITGVTVDEIDIHFGWNERVLLKAMQIHYASMSIRERMKHAKITGML